MDKLQIPLPPQNPTISLLQSPPIDNALLRRVLSRFATGVTVITAGHEDQDIGAITANSFTSVSMEPPLVLACIHGQSRVTAIIRHQQAFVINVLTSRQLDLAQRFAKPGGNKVEGFPFNWSSRGLPLLAESLCSIECRLYNVYPGGDHEIFIGRVLALHQSDADRALTFYSGAFSSLGEHTTTASEGSN